MLDFSQAEDRLLNVSRCFSFSLDLRASVWVSHSQKLSITQCLADRVHRTLSSRQSPRHYLGVNYAERALLTLD